MPGIRIDPSAATSATAEPEISAKNSDAPIDTCASPPRIQPNTDEAKAISRREIPDAFMIDPARMKSGIASSGKLVAPLYVTTARFGRTATPCEMIIATTATMPSDTAIGTLMITSASTAAKSTSIVMARPASSSMQAFRQRQAAGRLGGRALADQVDEMHAFGDHDQRRRDRNHRLHDAHRDLGHADERVGREDRHDRDADEPQQHEEADHEKLRDDVHDP